MLDQRRADVVLMLYKCSVFAGNRLKSKSHLYQYHDHVDSMLVYFWGSVANAGPALNQHWVDVFDVDQVNDIGNEMCVYTSRFANFWSQIE